MQFTNDPGSSPPSWEDLVLKEIKKPAAALRWDTNEGFSLEACYHASSPEARTTAAVIGQLLSQHRREEWYNMALVQANTGGANRQCLSALNGGCNALRIEGVEAEELAALLKGVEHPFIYLELHGKKPLDLAKAFLSYHNQFDGPGAKPSGLLNFSPFSHLVETGSWYRSEEKDLDELLQHIELVSGIAGYRGLEINAAIVAEAGGTLSQQIAFALLQGAEYLNRLSALGISADTSASVMKFHFATGQQYHLECVKLNVFRLLWAEVLQTHGVGNTDVLVTTVTSELNCSRHDAYNNLLRHTTASLSAVIGTSDGHVVLPYDASFAEPGEFSQRLARNINHLVTEEGHVHAGLLATAGSYFFENAQHLLMEQAWKLFLEWEQKGGFMAMIANGELQAAVQASGANIRSKFQQNERVIVGVNKYPNKQEKTPAQQKNRTAVMGGPLTVVPLAPLELTTAEVTQ